MDPNRDKLVKEIFASALDKEEAASRARYLAEACGGDEKLRQEVESLLQAHSQAGEFLQPKPTQPTGGALVEGPGDGAVAPATVHAQKLVAAGLDEMRRIIREQEPVRPSTRLSTMVKGDLTTVAKHRQADPPKLIHSVYKVAYSPDGKTLAVAGCSTPCVDLWDVPGRRRIASLHTNASSVVAFSSRATCWPQTQLKEGSTSGAPASTDSAPACRARPWARQCSPPASW